MGSQILPMMMMIIFTVIIVFILSSLQNTHITSAPDEHASVTLQKFRALLGLKSTKRRTSWDKNLSPSPSPCPSLEHEGLAPVPAPAPAPKLPRHLHSHRPFHHPIPILQPHILQKDSNKKERFRRALVAIISSGGATLLVSVLILIWVYSKYRKRQRESRGTLSVHSKKWRIRGKSSSLTLHSSVNKASSREFVLEEIDNGGEISSAASSSSTREITSVNGDAEACVRCDSEEEKSSSCGDKIIPIECHSSDDESFHSFADSSNLRLSNASAGSLSDPAGFSSPVDESMVFGSSPISMVPNIPEAKPAHSLNQEVTSDTNLSSPRRLSSSLAPNHITPGGAFPPPPPKFPSGIPPPPCPPFLKGNSSSKSSAKGPPPPPPSQLLAQQTPLGKDGAPLPKLKPLHWDKVRAPPEKRMVWDKIRSNSFEFDEEMIESLFGYNLRGTLKTEETKSKSSSPSNHVLDHKRLQNMTILSKALNSTPDQVRDSLLKGYGLGLQQLEALARMVPTDEEQTKLRNYKGNIDELGSAERFVKTLLTVPFAFDRVEAMLFRETFEDEVAHLRNSFAMLDEACKELRSSRLFLKLLEAVLKTGNRMNVGTIRGGALAFKLDALLKLSDVKGTDGKTTLLHFVVQEIGRTEGMRVSESIMGKINQTSKINKTLEEREENYRRMGLDLVSGLSTELYNVKKTATVDLDVLATSVSNLSTGVSKVNDLCRGDEEGFVGSMKGFLRGAEASVKEVKVEEDRVMSMVREVTEYFHGSNVSRDEVNPLRIFVIVRDFLGMLDHVCKELRSSKVAWSPNPLAPFR